MGQTGKELYVHTEDQYGNYVDLGYSGDVTFESLNKEVLLVDAVTGALTPLAEGTADVRIQVGAVDTVVTVQVGAEAEASALVLDKTEINVSESVTAAQAINIEIQDQYADTYVADDKNVTAEIISGSDYITLDNTEKTPASGLVTFNVTADKAGTAVIEFGIKGTEVTETVTVNVEEAGEIEDYVVEGFKAQLDQYDDPDTTTVDESTMELDVYGVDANGVKVGDALADGEGSITITDKNGDAVAGYDATGLDTVINAADFTADESYTLTVTVGTLDVFEQQFSVVNTAPAPTAEQIAGTIDANGNVGQDIFTDLEGVFEIKFNGEVQSSASLIDITFVSDNINVINSATDATTVTTLAEGSATLAIQEIKVDLDGDTVGTTGDQYVIDVSALVDVNVDDTTAPAAVTKFVADDATSSSNVDLTWDANGDADFDHFELYLGTDNNGTLLDDNLTSTSYTYDATGQDGQSLDFAIYAVDANGNASDVATANVTVSESN